MKPTQTLMVTSNMFNSVLTRYVKRKKENTTSSHIVGNVGTSHCNDRVVLVLSTSIGTGRSLFSIKSGDKQILLSDAMATPSISTKTTSTMKIDNAASFLIIHQTDKETYHQNQERAVFLDLYSTIHPCY